MSSEKLHPAMFLLVNQIRQSCGFSTADEDDLREWGDLDAAIVAQSELMAEGVRAAASEFDGKFGARQVSMILFDLAARLERNEGDPK